MIYQNIHLRFLLLLPAVMASLHGSFAQQSGAPKYSLSYTETTSTRFEINQADREQLMPFEAAGMQGTDEVRHVSIVCDNNNEITTTIEIEPATEGEPWMKTPRKIISDKNGTRLYDANNQLLRQSSHTATSLATWQQLNTGIVENGWRTFPAFVPITENDLSRLRQAGFTTEVLPEGGVKLNKENLEIRYNPAAMTAEFTHYENGKADALVQLKYRTEQGIVTPASRIEKSYTTSPSGICYAVVTTSLYSSYSRTEPN